MSRPRATLILVVLAVLLGLTTLTFPRGGWDIPTYTYIGQTILEGGLPYKDAWDLKGPGTFFTYALNQAVFGRSAMGLRAFDILWQMAMAMALAAIARRVYGNERAALLAGALYLIAYYARNLWDWSQADSMVSLPLALAVLSGVEAVRSDRRRDWVLAGLWVGVAVLFKMPVGVLGIALLLAAFLTGSRERRLAAQRSVLLAAGFATPLAACAVYFYLGGGLRDLMIAQFQIAPEYVTYLRSYRGLGCLTISSLQPVLLPTHAMGGVAAISLAWPLIRRHPLGSGRWMLLAWLVTALASLVLHGKFDSMHFMPLLAPLAVITGGALAEWWHSGARVTRVMAVALAAVFLIVPVKKIPDHARVAARFARSVPASTLSDLGVYLREHTRPNEGIFVWGNSPMIYLDAERRSASRFVHTYFLGRLWRNADLRQPFIEDLRGRPPAYFVVLRRAVGAAPDTVIDFRCPPERIDSREQFQEFRELQEFLSASYVIEQEQENYILYRKGQR